MYRSPTFYWLFNYIFDVILCVVWFSYLLMIFCIVDVAFNGSPSSRTSTAGITPIEFATSWDLRIQFYPLTILIALPTLPFVYLLTKIFKSDILVCSYHLTTPLVYLFPSHHCCLGWINNLCHSHHYSFCQCHCSNHHDDC